ncbi:PREDICTED: uncharacterized protein LOC107087321 [Cyprinodon variegatus]|uniref:uncharacterized protein LOC107087321 n=1 Tax=Cyprinodon variegatus TaxID=28743 RepID=UPI000742CC45|nr:PREDICTED: uncharacterized protein LOC107087321 [Cyprinodon variegatus]
MKYIPGLLGVACAYMLILVEGLAERNGSKKHIAGGKCYLKELAALTKHQVEESLISFDKANGQHLGTWLPGFPELQVHKDSFNGPKVQCSLTFMALGLEKILEDQKNDLNPTDVLLHKMLWNTISRVMMLKACMEDFLKGKCPEDPLPPKMPKHVFDRKQWSHTLLKSAKYYLDWMEHKIIVSKAKEFKKKTNQVKNTTLHKYIRGSVYHL